MTPVIEFLSLTRQIHIEFWILGFGPAQLQGRTIEGVNQKTEVKVLPTFSTLSSQPIRSLLV